MDHLAPRPDPRPGGVFGASFRRRRRKRDRHTATLAGTAVALLVVVALAGGSWLWLRAGSGPATTPESPSIAGMLDRGPPVEAPAGPAPVAPADSAPDPPELDASDAVVRDLVAGLSERPRLASWLATDDLVRRFVASVVSVASGASPREHVEHLAPDGRFRVRRAGDRTVVDPAGYERYDLFAATFASLDSRGTARLYHRLRPLFVEANGELGAPAGTFDEALARAVRALLAVEVPDEPPEVVLEEGAWAFADPALESRTAAEKHLLRMGPDNARRVQAKLRELAGAIGLEVSGPAGGSGGRGGGTE